MSPWFTAPASTVPATIVPWPCSVKTLSIESLNLPSVELLSVSTAISIRADRSSSIPAPVSEETLYIREPA
ncbi:MAG: hypothetical protein BWX47_01124 [candidate division Hyd24-12 bacterium ADurb.Bin004]|nr:MAG: hypothetical protein BWX47_01124 [candidate division Hyd24-12 bacterium ADurb.Bin004]